MLALQFPDAALEATFREHYFSRVVGQYRLCLALSLGLWGVIFFAGPMLYPQIGLQARLGVGLVVLPAIAAAVGLTYSKPLRKWLSPVGAVTVVTVGLVELGLLELAGETDRFGFAGLMVQIACAAFAMRMRFVHFLASSVVQGCWLMALVASHPHEHPGRQLFAIIFFTLTMETFAMAGAYVLERSERDLFLQGRLIEEQRRSIEAEREKSDRLLLNVLPASIATQLKDRPERIAEAFPEATILFADLVGFTTLASRLEPKALVALLDEIFSAFDDLAERHGLEKIKTIGDAYMAVAGLPSPRSDHALAAARMALQMFEAVAACGQRAGHELELRVGIHTGPVVAGVIGKRKFSYDLWGDAVNTASRMESHGAPGRIHVSDAARVQLGEGFQFEARGTVEVKGKGPMSTWWLGGAAAR